MAKKSKSKAKKPKAKRKAPAIKSTASIRLPSSQVLASLAKLSDECKARSRSATGTIGQAIKDASEHKNLNPAAFKMVNRLRQIGDDDPIKLRGILDHFDAYRDSMGLDKLKAPHMLDDRKKSTKKRSQKSGNGMAPIGDAAQSVAVNVVTLADAMADAIERDRAAKGEMDAA